MVEWLERLGYGAGSRPKVVSLQCDLAVNGYPFSNKGRIRQRKERGGLRLSSAVPKIQRDSNLNRVYGY